MADFKMKSWLLYGTVMVLCCGFTPPVDMPAEFRAEPAKVLAAAAATTAARFPDADAVIVDDRIHTAYEPSGAYVTWDDEWVKVLTEKGRRSCSSVTLDYSERYGDAGIFSIEIIGTNGVVRTVDFASTLKVATDNSSMGANIVDPLDKQISCSVPGLAVGEVRHVRFWRRAVRARMREAWSHVEVLEHTLPILATTLTVDAPAELPLAHAVVRQPYSNSVVRAEDRLLPGGRRQSRWTVGNVPQVFAEPNMPPLSCCAQTLRLSTVKDWPTVSRWYWGLCANHLAKTTAAMTNKVTALVKNCRSEEERIRSVFKFVSQEVRYMGLTLEDDSPGYEPHDVDITFDKRYGVCRDKAALLVALLRIAGVKAYPVLIHAGAKMDREVPSPYFNHAIVAVESANSNYQLMDPTDESTKDLLPAYLSDKSYLVARPEGEQLRTSPVASVAANLLRVDSEGTLDANGNVLLASTFTLGGINDTAVRHSLLKKTPEERRRWFEGIWRGVAAGAELLSMELSPADLRDTDHVLGAKTVVRLPECLRRGRTRDALALPFATCVLSVANGILDENTALERRRFPLVLPCTAGTEETLRLTLGDSAGKLLSLPPPCEVKTEGYDFARKVACSNGVLNARRTMGVGAVNFPVAAYDALRNARKEVETAERTEPFFGSRKDADANVHVRRETLTIHYDSPRSWVATNVVEKEILTYRGKQTSSELKFTYAPCTRQVELVSATVSNRNGKVFSVRPSEINFMDCDWAASAPRYPASRILVANLPGVEIGSVVRYVVARTVTNSPVAAAFSYTFGGRSPVDYERLELHVPESMRFHQSSQRISAGGFSCRTNAGERVYAWTMNKVPREPDESSQPPLGKWRPTVTVSCADWNEYGEELTTALDSAREAPVDSEKLVDVGAMARQAVADCATASERIRAIRRCLRRVRVTGPGIFELPFDRAFTPPSRVLAEGYGSRTDYMNLFRMMLEEVGFECSFVLSANDALGFHGAEKGWRAMPRPTTFGTLLVRAVWREGWIPFLRDETVFWLSNENEYTPPEAVSGFGNAVYCPETDEFSRIPKPSASGRGSEWVRAERNRCRIEVRENGAVDFDVTNCVYGARVGSLRKTFAEMLPELRSRFYQKLLGGLAQNATATSELTTDVDGYPFKFAFGAYAEGYVAVQGNALTIKLPDFEGKVFGVDGGRRRSPIALNGENEVVDVYEVVFPKGYGKIEQLPLGFQIRNPLNRNEVWVRQEVSSRRIDGRLHVTVRRRTFRAKAVMLAEDLHPFLLDWNRRAASAAARTICVRK